MARARNIKPGFFKNEDLAECSVWARLLFPGLWMLADRDGRLEDRPKRIKGEIFPFDSVEVDPLLNELVEWGFIRRYTAGGKKCIQIINFVLHQSPHSTEKDSDLPDENGDYTVNERLKNGCITGKSIKTSSIPTEKQAGPPATTVNPQLANSATTVSPQLHNTLNPESGFLNPESPILGGGEREAQSASPHPPPIFSPENREFIKTERPDLDAAVVWLNFCDHYPGDKCTPANWRKWVRREMRGPVPGGDPPPAAATADPDSKASVEAVGLARGMGRWDQLFEPWQAYKTRVKNASSETLQ